MPGSVRGALRPRPARLLQGPEVAFSSPAPDELDISANFSRLVVSLMACIRSFPRFV